MIAKNKIVRIILMIVGFISLGLGTVGVILPILPTAPFLLLTSFCFVRSSEKFNNWFLNTKLYKNHLENFASHRVMTIKGELILLLCVSAMLITSIILVDKLVVTVILTILIFCKYFYFVMRVQPVSKDEYEKIRLGDIDAR